jgi:hypothetical protein
MDLISEIRGAFASDAVWLTNLEPLSDYNPLVGKVGDPKSQSGKSVVKAEFVTTAYGSSSLVDLKPESTDEEKKPNPRGAPAPALGAMANAVRIKGYWRENPKGQDVVSELLKNLKDKSTNFEFKIKDPKDPKGTEVDLKVDQYFAITVSGKQGEFGLPFEIVLPLVRKVSIK